MRLVLCNGVFDLIHPAHIRHLEAARQLGDFLVVGLTMDAGVRKDGRPIMREDERLDMLRAVRCVSAVTLCHDSLEALAQWRPDIYCKGGDYRRKGLLPAEVRYCAEHGIRIAHTKFDPLTTSSIIERIKCAS